MAQWNSRNPAVKRILQELRELQRDDDPDILAEALEDNIFEWHFVVRGAWDSEFEGGIYHGRILMPAEYPFKPPAFVMLTPSGRFETGVKICLSISSHHPESWQPSWSVRSALIALRAFMQTPGNGALGSLDHPAEARRQMAAQSRTAAPKYGPPERQQLLAEMQRRMLDMEDRSRALCTQERTADAGPNAAADLAGAEAATTTAAAAIAPAPAGPEAAHTPQQHSGQDAAPAAEPAAAGPAMQAAPAVAAAAPMPLALEPAAPPAPAQPELRHRAAAAASPGAGFPAVAPSFPAAAPLEEPAVHMPAGAQLLHHPRHSWEDRGLTYLAVLLALCIAALLIRKVVVAFSFSSDELYSFNHVEGVEL